MKTSIILNPGAGSVRRRGGALIERAHSLGFRVLLIDRDHRAERLAREAAEAGAECVLAAGGDGTASQVAKGLMTLSNPPAFGVLPLGTGNDFARSLRMPFDVDVACEWLASLDGPTGRADVLRARSERQHALAINCVNGGIAHAIREETDPEQKARWGPLAMALAGLEIAGGDLPHWSIRYRLDDGPTRSVEAAVSVMAANARTVGGGFEVAPTANIEDGRFELVIVSGERMIELLDVAVRTTLGRSYESDYVQHSSGRRLELEVPDGFGFTVDGEAFEGREVVVELQPAALPFVAGPEFRLAAEAAPQTEEAPA